MRAASLAAAAAAGAAAAGAVPLDAAAAGGTVGTGLFGHNLEFTRHDLFAGLSAQLVANRQFVVPPDGTKWPYAWDVAGGFPPRWAPVGGATAARPGCAGPRTSAVRCAAGPAGGCGVSQGTIAEGFDSGAGAGSAIPLQAGRAYTARVTARAAAPAHVRVDVTPAAAYGYELTVPPPAGGSGQMCSDDTKITDLPCGNCGPNWGDLAACERLCSARADCANITYFANRGCRAYTSCPTLVPVPGDYHTQGFVYRRVAGNGTGHGPAVSASFAVPGTGDWVTLSADVTAAYGANDTVLSVVSADGAAFDVGAVSLMPADNFLGMRRDVIARLKEIGFRGPLRFPGGCFAPFYSWRDALLPPDRRPPPMTPPDYCAAVSGGVNAYTDGAVETGLSTDEFAALCEELGMKPSVTFPLQFGTAAELDGVREWVEYANGGAGTPMGALRAQNGHAAPYDIKYWTLGNEINLQTRWPDYPNSTRREGHPSAEEYAGIAAAAASAAIAASPTPLHLFFVGQNGWYGPVSGAVPPGAQYSVSVHDGYHDQGALAKPSDYTAAAQTGETQLIGGLRAARAALNRSFSLSADEWGLGPPWSAPADAAGRRFGVAHAMYAAGLLGSVIRGAADVGAEFTNYFEVVNEGGITVGPFSADLTPVGQVLARYAAHQGCALLDAGAVGKLTGISAVASVCGGKELRLTLANLDAVQARSADITVVNATAAGDASVATLAAAELAPGAGFDASSHTTPASGGSFSVAVPPYAVAHVTLPIHPARGAR